MSGDGIYSRYLTNYPSEGRYEFSVTVEDNSKRAYYISEATRRSRRAMPIVRGSSDTLSWRRSGVVKRCCGSRVFVPQIQRQITGEFRTRQPGPVIHLLQVPNQSLDLMPPSKVGDLRVKVLDDQKTLLAVWTAPGDDYDHGAVSGYRFVYASNITAMLDPATTTERLATAMEFQRPDRAGIQTSYQFEFDHFNRDYFIGIVAFDERRNEGQLSNIVTVRLDSNDVSHEAGNGNGGPVSSPAASPDPEESDEGIMIGALCGAFVVIALLLWAGIWYHRNKGQNVKSTKKSGVTANLVNKTGEHLADTSSSDIDIKMSPARPARTSSKVPQFSSLASGGPVYPGKRDDGDADTPTYWSASQLLEQHEQVRDSLT